MQHRSKPFRNTDPCKRKRPPHPHQQADHTQTCDPQLFAGLVHQVPQCPEHPEGSGFDWGVCDAKNRSAWFLYVFLVFVVFLGFGNLAWWPRLFSASDWNSFLCIFSCFSCGFFGFKASQTSPLVSRQLLDSQKLLPQCRRVSHTSFFAPRACSIREASGLKA